MLYSVVGFFLFIFCFVNKGQETEQLCVRRENEGGKHERGLCWPAVPVDLLTRRVKVAVAAGGAA